PRTKHGKRREYRIRGMDGPEGAQARAMSARPTSRHAARPAAFAGHFARGLAVMLGLVVFAPACGSAGFSLFGEGQKPTDAPVPGDIANGFNTDAGAVDLYANDPPQLWCGVGSVPAPPMPGGTPLCPDDKNKAGCPCSNEELGKTAPCWEGLRAQRGVGVC